MFRLLALMLIGVCAVACGNSPAAAPDAEHAKEWTRGKITIRATGSDSIWARRLLDPSATSALAVEEYLGGEFAGRVTITIFPTRSALTEYWRVAWQAPAFVPQCWMVADATRTEVSLLSPARWPTQACNNPADSAYVVRVVHHELVHVLHLQQTPQLAIDDMRWFFEGVATYVSGQYGPAGATQAKALLQAGFATPALRVLANAEAAYVLAPSVVAFIEMRWGRDVMRALVRATTTAGMLSALATTEAALLADWRAWLLA